MPDFLVIGSGLINSCHGIVPGDTIFYRQNRGRNICKFQEQRIMSHAQPQQDIKINLFMGKRLCLKLNTSFQINNGFRGAKSVCAKILDQLGVSFIDQCVYLLNSEVS